MTTQDHEKPDKPSPPTAFRGPGDRTPLRIGIIVRRRREALLDRQDRLRCCRRAGRRIPRLGPVRHGWAELRRHQRARRGHQRRRLGVRARGQRLRRLRAVARDQQVRADPARQGRRGSGVQDHLVDRDDVQCRDGHRPDVLRRRRTTVPFHVAASRNGRRPATPEAFDTAMATTLVPLDIAPVGDLRGGGPGHRLQHLPQGPPAVDQLDLRPAAGQARTGGWLRPRHRHPGDLRHPVRVGRLPGSWRTADRRRSRCRRIHRFLRHQPARRDHRDPDHRLHRLRGLRGLQGHPVVVEHQHGAGRRAGGRWSSSAARPS